MTEFEHYPPDDIVGPRTGCQFYYHAHRDGDREHGHLHLFWHATASGRRRYLRPGHARWTRTAPTHLFAISLNARGLPVGLFTVNRWVTDGHWFEAATAMSMVERFAVSQVNSHEHSCNWLTSFVSLYRPLIGQLLMRRDRRLARLVEFGRHDIIPGVAGDPSGYLVVTKGEGNIAYIKWTVRAVFLPGKDGKPEINDNGFWEVVSGTGTFKDLKGAGTLHIKAANPTDRIFILEGNLVPAS